MRKYDVGDRIERLVILDIKQVKLQSRRRVYATCLCDCGNTKDIRLDTLGKTKSCGCLNREPKVLIHGESGTKLYQVWATMKDRCKNPNSTAYRDYGGRGINYHNTWEQYIPFRNWAIENGYEDGLELDRINNDGNYEPSNCRWTTRKQQTLNTRSNKYIVFKGRRQTVSQWAEEFNVKYMDIYNYCYKYNIWSGDVVFKELFGKV